jgi:RNA polymerase sigma factor (sigma-70 family)
MVVKSGPTPQEQLFADRVRFQRRLVEHFGGKLTWEDAEDVTAAAVADTALTKPDGRTSVERTEWFWKILRNDAIDLLRSRGLVAREGRKARPRTVALVVEDDGEEQPDASRERLLAAEDLGFVEVEDAMDHAYDRGDAVRAARKGLDALSRRDRDLVRFKYDEGLTLKQMAAELDVSEQHVSKLWRDALVAFRDAVAGVGVTSPDSECGVLRLIVASREIDVVDPEGITRWEIHLEQCTSCRVWDFAGKQAAGAIPSLPLGGGLVGGLLGKLGLGGLADRLHGMTDQVSGAVGLGGGGAGAGAGVLSAIGGKAAATCITAAVCAGGAAFVAAPVVQRAVDPPKKEHRDKVASKTHGKAAGGSGAQRPATTISSAPAAVAPAPQVARKATRTQAPMQTTPAQRKAKRERERVVREKAQAKKARAAGSSFTPEGYDPTPAATPTSPSASSSTAPVAPATTPPPAPADSSSFSGEFSP